MNFFIYQKTFSVNSFGNLNVSQHTEQIFSSFMTSSKMEIEIWSFEITYNHISDADLDMFSSNDLPLIVYAHKSH
jgi:hypothetical protein